MVIVSTILYVDMLRFANSFSAQLNDFIILVINWIFCIFVFIINLAIAIYGFVCGCCYSKEFEKIIQNEQPKSAFSFTTSNKVLFHLAIRILKWDESFRRSFASNPQETAERRRRSGRRTPLYRTPRAYFNFRHIQYLKRLLIQSCHFTPAPY